MGEKMTNQKTSRGEEQAEKERWRVISVHKGGVVKEIQTAAEGNSVGPRRKQLKRKAAASRVGC